MKYKILVLIAAIFLLAMVGPATAAPTLTWEQRLGSDTGVPVNCGFTDDINVCRENIRRQLLQTPYVSEIQNLVITAGTFTPSITTGGQATAQWTANRRGTVVCLPGQTMEQCRGAYMQGSYIPQAAPPVWVGGFGTFWPGNAVFLPETFGQQQPWIPPGLPSMPTRQAGGTAPWNKVVKSPSASTTWTPELWACSMYGQCR